MTSPDDRFLEVLTDSQFDDVIELMLLGIVVEPELEPVARFSDEAGALVAASPPPASPELAALLAGEPLADDLLPEGARRAAAIARTCLPQRGSRRRSGRGGVVAQTSARVAAMSLAAKTGLGLALAGVGATGAGAAGVVPDVVDAVRHSIEVVTPFEPPVRASAGAGSEGLPGASDTPRPGGGTGASSLSAWSPAPVDPPETVPPPDDTPIPPASPPVRRAAGSLHPDPARAPHPDGPLSRPGDAIPDSGGLPNEAGNANPDHSPRLDGGGLPSEAGGADVGGSASQPGVADVGGPGARQRARPVSRASRASPTWAVRRARQPARGGPPDEAANAAGPSLTVTTAISGCPLPGEVADPEPDGSSCRDAAGDFGGIVDGPEARAPACRVAGLRL